MGLWRDVGSCWEEEEEVVLLEEDGRRGRLVLAMRDWSSRHVVCSAEDTGEADWRMGLRWRAGVGMRRGCGKVCAPVVVGKGVRSIVC